MFNAVNTAGNREFKTSRDTIQWVVTDTEAPKKVTDISVFLLMQFGS